MQPPDARSTCDSRSDVHHRCRRKSIQKERCNVQLQGANTNEAVMAIQEITSVINSINDISNGIAAAIEEQGAVTQEISSNMLTASNGVQAITQNMARIQGATEAASQSARTVMEASKSLVA
jgi:methyl-accepting chemotaxis protein